jgi:hypothetical protein
MLLDRATFELFRVRFLGARGHTTLDDCPYVGALESRGDESHFVQAYP